MNPAVSVAGWSRRRSAGHVRGRWRAPAQPRRRLFVSSSDRDVNLIPAEKPEDPRGVVHRHDRFSGWLPGSVLEAALKALGVFPLQGRRIAAVKLETSEILGRQSAKLNALVFWGWVLGQGALVGEGETDDPLLG